MVYCELLSNFGARNYGTRVFDRPRVMTDENLSLSTTIVRVDRFIQATRDSGYRGTPSAIAELVDNSIQAGAKSIHILIDRSESEYPLRVIVADNGRGMDAAELQEALRFGGSSRFGAREGLGRFGMGLPNASLSQARRLEVYTWQAEAEVPLYSYMDVDEVASGSLASIPAPRPRRIPPDLQYLRRSRAGTVVILDRADRLDNRRVSTTSRKLELALGRVFRHYLWGGVRISLNGEPVQPIDPLFVARQSYTSGAELVDEWSCMVRNTDDADSPVGAVHVSFSLLPIRKWHSLSIAEKRAAGIVNGAGVSVVRGGREVDYGWFFLPGRRKQNYDDWWRCEVRFDPVLDDAFGVTHTKQQVRPARHLVEAISPYVEMTAKELHARVRSEYQQVESVYRSERQGEDANCAEARDAPEYSSASASALPDSRVLSEGRIPGPDGRRYRVVEGSGRPGLFFDVVVSDDQIVITLDRCHPFFQHVYGPLTVDGPSGSKTALDALLIAAAKADSGTVESDGIGEAHLFYRRWSSALEALLVA